MIPLRDHNPSKTFPIINTLLIIINIGVYLYMNLLNSTGLINFINLYAFIPNDFEFLDLITSQFLHAGLGHLVGNMLFLHIFGENLEDYLGHIKYLFFYLACGILAALAQYFISTNSNIPVLGASGAIAGTMGGYLLLFPQAKVDILIPLGLSFPVITVSAYYMLLYWIISQFLLGIGSVGETGGGIAYFAHIGGFVAGIILVKIFSGKPQPNYS